MVRAWLGKAIYDHSKWDGPWDHLFRVVGGRTPRDGIQLEGMMVPLIPMWIMAAKVLQI